MAPIFDDLHDDILMQVFAKLSYKQSRQCSLVCRRWRNLVSEYSFVSQYTSFQRTSNQVHQPFVLLFQHCTLSRYPTSTTSTRIRRLVPIDHHLYTTLHKTRPFFSLNFLPTTSSTIHILRYSNDLFLCTEDLDKHDVYYICNPVSKQWISLPPTPSPHRRAIVGFYCDISYDKYENGSSTIWIVKNLQKYIVLRHLEVYSSMELEVFYSETNTWRNYVESVPQEYFTPSSWILMAIMFNGKLWYMHTDTCIYVYNPDQYSNEQRWDIMYPQEFMITAIHTWGIWELDDDVREWSLVHKVYLKDLDEKFNQSLRSIVGSRFNMQGIHFHPVDEDIIYIVFYLGYFEYNVRLKVMEFHPIEIRTEKQGLFMGRRDPFMQPCRRATPILEI
ncbi:hypothetical protein ACFE04_002603 [Oxalis oulophora]